MSSKVILVVLLFVGAVYSAGMINDPNTGCSVYSSQCASISRFRGFPHPNKCNAYCFCSTSDRTPKEERCPSNYHYVTMIYNDNQPHLGYEVCDKPEKVNCRRGGSTYHKSQFDAAMDDAIMH